MTAKEHLQSVYYIQKRMDRLNDLRESIRNDMYSLKSPAGQTQDRVQTSVNGDRMLQLIARVDEIERDTINELSDLTETKLKVEQEIEEIPNESYKQLLYDRYIRCLRWERIALDRDKGIRWIYRLHKKSLDAFEKVWEGH